MSWLTVKKASPVLNAYVFAVDPGIRDSNSQTNYKDETLYGYSLPFWDCESEFPMQTPIFQDLWDILNHESPHELADDYLWHCERQK